MQITYHSDATLHNTKHQEQQQQSHRSRRSRFDGGSRMAGSTPVWTPQKTQETGQMHKFAQKTPDIQHFNSFIARIQDDLAQPDAQKPVKGDNPAHNIRRPEGIEVAILNEPPEVIKPQETVYNSHTDSEEFGFGDFLDIVNPLQHLPVVSHVYREVTGDEVSGIARIVGGAIYGGPVGAASGIVNTIVEAETGTDIAGNLLTIVNKPGVKPSTEQRFAQIQKALDAERQSLNELPESVLSFTDAGSVYKETARRTFTDSRMAGSYKSYKPQQAQTVSGSTAEAPLKTTVLERKPLTELNLSTMEKPQAFGKTTLQGEAL